MQPDDLSNPDILISTAELEQRLGDPALRLLDTTVLMSAKPGGGTEIRSGRAEYEAAHIPGAQFIDLITELSDRDDPRPFMMPPEPQFIAAMSRHGIGRGTWIVACNSGPTWWSTRLFFMLRAYGFDAVRVLDGGLDKWRAEGRPLTATASPAPAVAEFVPGTRRACFVDRHAVLGAVQRGGRRLVHALSPELFSGRAVGYGRPGRIPGSINVPGRELLDPATQAFLPPAALRARLEAAGLLQGPPAITYCGGGISATTPAFALLLLGRDDAAIYDASMSEWGRDPSLPMESG
ncbi:MAG: sulfurtransferase [Steroidobacteraceae bacterium]